MAPLGVGVRLRHRRGFQFLIDSASVVESDLWQTIARAEPLLDDLATGRPAGPELDGLLGYLREVVLARIAEEEWQVFRALGRGEPAHPDIDRLRLNHLRPGEQVELRGHGDPQRLWHRLERRAAGDFSWSERPDEPHGWIVAVARRTRTEAAHAW